MLNWNTGHSMRYLRPEQRGLDVDQIVLLHAQPDSRHQRHSHAEHLLRDPLQRELRGIDVPVTDRAGDHDAGPE